MVGVRVTHNSAFVGEAAEMEMEELQSGFLFASRGGSFLFFVSKDFFFLIYFCFLFCFFKSSFSG